MLTFGMTAPNRLILNEGGCWIAMADGEEKPITEVRKRESVQTPERRDPCQRVLLPYRPFTL